MLASKGRSGQRLITGTKLHQPTMPTVATPARMLDGSTAADRLGLGIVKPELGWHGAIGSDTGDTRRNQ